MQSLSSAKTQVSAKMVSLSEEHHFLDVVGAIYEFILYFIIFYLSCHSSSQLRTSISTSTRNPENEKKK